MVGTAEGGSAVRIGSGLPIPRAHIGRNCPVSGLTVVWDWTENYINLHFVSDCANVCSNWKFRHESSDLAKAPDQTDALRERVTEDMNIKKN